MQMDLIYDWNQAETEPEAGESKSFMLDDETLRDGIQSPSARDPGIEEKLRILHLMHELGVDAADLGLPGASARQRADVKRLAEEIRDQKLDIFPNCAARTVIADIEPILDVAEQVGIPIEVSCFIGSSPIRQYAEDWDIDTMLGHSERAVKFAVDRGMPVMYVTEDTSRARPETIRRLYSEAVRLGAQRVCVTDTVGHATPDGTTQLIRFVREVVDEAGGSQVGIDWHGHRDRGLGLANSLAAFRAGATRVHGCGLGIGERSSNAVIDLLLVNLKLLGWIVRDLTKLGDYCRAISAATGVPIPGSFPVVGADAFETATGVHAAAVIKAYRKGDAWLADRVYSGVPAGMFGLEQVIKVGPMSGKSNVTWFLERRGVEPTEERVERVLAKAKQTPRNLTAEEVLKAAGA